MIAKDRVLSFRPVEITLAPNPGVLQPDGSYRLPAGTTSFSLTPRVVDEGAIPNTGQPNHYAYKWAILGGRSAMLTSETAPATTVHPLFPGDAIHVTLTLTTDFETQIISLDVVVPL